MAQHATALEGAFGELASRRDGSLERELAKRGLLDPRGPNPLDVPALSEVAIDLAYALARSR